MKNLNFNNLSPKKSILIGFSFSLLLLLVIHFISLLSITKLENNREITEYTYQQIQTIDEIFDGVQDMERGRRGYLLTHDKSFLKTCENGLKKSQAKLQILDKLTVKESHSEINDIKELEVLINQKIRDNETSLTLFEENKADLKNQIDLTKKYQKQGEKIDNLINKIIKEKRNLLRENTDDLYDSINEHIFWSNIAFGFSFVLLFSVYLLLNKQINYNQKIAKNLDESNHELAKINSNLQNEIEKRITIQKQLQTITKELKRSNRELEQFAYIASHDLQEPLRTITSYSQLLAKRYQDQLDDKANKYIYYIVDGATRMSQLIEDLLSYSRAGRLELNLELTDFNLIIKQVLHNLQPTIRKNSAQIKVDFLPTIIADSCKIIQLFQNLISNGIKYHNDQPPQINISAVEQDNQWVFSVKDNGIGIEPQYFERIFVIFQRLHTRQEYPGTGIGLALCKKIVERHNGNIWVESELGKGTTFYFSLPITISHK